ncbi:MAG: hypothetical protein AAF236_16070 [Verrucomicrobiota bacterium]
MREVSALCGLLAALGAVALGLGWLRTLAAVALAATSPLLIYYSRLFLHEPVLLACAIPGLAGILLFLRKNHLWPAAFLLGIGVGLMAATRETVVISLIAWTIAGFAFLYRAQDPLAGPSPQSRFRAVFSDIRVLALPTATAAILTLLIIFGFYSNGGKNPAGFLRFFETYFAYETGEGHDKSPAYYANLLIWPKHLVARWWSEGAIFLLSLLVYLDRSRGSISLTGRFLFEAGVIHILIFSLFSYKTPWLPSLGWLHLCFAAGVGGIALISRIRQWGTISATVAAALLTLVPFWHAKQAKLAAFRLPSDGRNPYAYVPTSRDVQTLGPFIAGLRKASPEHGSEPVAVVGAEYWPLPWYLRNHEPIGYWLDLPENGAEFPILVMLPKPYNKHVSALAETHTFIPKGLRHETPIMVAIRKDIWEAYQQQP